ncbi:MAG: branched-chain amino acid ABC transporter permease [Deltaproteobacteria bacterium]|jgi:branched-chain amino acid transport system permease protein|nr:branched-chain amino acid ABC transporter permease [Deltaproteobacteria bacterium]
MTAYLESLAVLCAIAAILASSLDLVLGFAGIFSVAHAVFFGIGAYAASLVALHLTASLAFALAVAMAAGAGAGLLLAVPALRVREEYFVVASLGFQVVATTVFEQWQAVTGGIGGLTGIPPPTVAGLKVESYAGMAALSVLLAGAVLAGLRALVRSRLGRALQALNQDEVAAQAAGHNPVTLRTLAVVVSCSLASVGGVIYAFFSSFVNPESFTLDESVRVMVMVIMGGAGTTAGPLLGALFVTLFPALLSFLTIPDQFLGPIQRLAYGLIVVVLMVYEPDGMVGLARRLRRLRALAPAGKPGESTA